MDRSEVTNIAHLARLAISEEDVESYSTDLSNILTLVERMNSVDVEGITPMAHPLNMSQRLRVDEVREADQRTVLQKHSPLVENGLFLVPTVIE